MFILGRQFVLTMNNKRGSKKLSDNNQELIRARARKRWNKWRKNNLEREKERTKEWRKNNPELSKKYSKKWRKNNPELSRKSSKKWKEDNPELAQNSARIANIKWRRKNILKIKRKYMMSNKDIKKKKMLW